jgi:hypothetical protein
MITRSEGNLRPRPITLCHMYIHLEVATYCELGSHNASPAVVAVSDAGMQRGAAREGVRTRRADDVVLIEAAESIRTSSRP